MHETIQKSKILEMPSTSSEEYRGNPLAEPMPIKCDVDYDDNDWPGFGDEMDNLSNDSLGEPTNIVYHRNVEKVSFEPVKHCWNHISFQVTTNL